MRKLLTSATAAALFAVGGTAMARGAHNDHAYRSGSFDEPQSAAASIPSPGGPTSPIGPMEAGGTAPARAVASATVQASDDLVASTSPGGPTSPIGPVEAGGTSTTG